MSRVAKAPIQMPANVEVMLDKNIITVKGPKGSLNHKLNKLVQIKKDESEANVYRFSAASKDPNAWAQAGTARALVNNMVRGVTEGFSLTLELVGVGYRAQTKGNALSLSLGYSHPIEYQLPEAVKADMPNNTTIVLTSINKQILGQAAAEIRSFRPPEPYKGKGVKYAGETIVRKEAKKK